MYVKVAGTTVSTVQKREIRERERESRALSAV
jgi:hypothetical protein